MRIATQNSQDITGLPSCDSTRAFSSICMIRFDFLDFQCYAHHFLLQDCYWPLLRDMISTDYILKDYVIYSFPVSSTVGESENRKMVTEQWINSSNTCIPVNRTIAWTEQKTGWTILAVFCSMCMGKSGDIIHSFMASSTERMHLLMKPSKRCIILSYISTWKPPVGPLRNYNSNILTSNRWWKRPHRRRSWSNH